MFAMFQLNPAVFTDIFKVVSSNRLVKRRMYLNPWWPICLCWFLTVPDFLFGAIMMIVFYFALINLDFYWIAAVCSSAIFAIFGVLWPCCCFVSNRKVRQITELSSIMVKAISMILCEKTSSYTSP